MLVVETSVKIRTDTSAVLAMALACSSWACTSSMMSPVDSGSCMMLIGTAWPLAGKNWPFFKSVARLLLG